MRLLFITLFMAVLIFPGAASPVDVQRDQSMFRGFGSRSDGTDGEKAAIEYIAEVLDEMLIGYERYSLGEGVRGHSFSENLIARIPGSGTGTYILAAPIDDGAFASAILLDVARELLVNPPKHTVVLAFLGAERGDTRFHPYGSRAAAARLQQNGDGFVFYLDGEVVPNFWYFRTGGDGQVAPSWLISAVTEVFSSGFIPFGLRGTDIQVARLGRQGPMGPLKPWLDADFPVILAKGTGAAPAEEYARRVSRLVNALTTIDRLIDGIPETRGTSYVFLRPLSGMIPRIIPELPLVSVLLIVTAILLTAVLTQYRSITLNIRRFAEHWWAWPLIAVLVFLFLFLATLYIEETVLIADFPDLWKSAPGIFIFFKLTIAAALSLNFILITRGLPLPRSPHYYAYAAVVTSGVATLVFMAVDITLAAYSLWTNFTLMLFTATRREGRKAILLLLSIIPYVAGLIVIVGEPYSLVIESMILTRLTGNLILGLLLLPVILSITSMSYWRMHYHRTRHSVLTPAATLALSLSAVVTLFWILNITPYDTDNPQPVGLVDRIDLNTGQRRIEITSPAPIGDVDLILDGVDYSLENLGRNAEVKTPLNRTPLEIRHSSRNFLGRRTVSVTISGEEAPIRLNVELKSSKPFTLHEASMPFSMSPTGTSAAIYIGDNPPFPFTAVFTVNEDADLSINTTATWANPAVPPRVERSDMTPRATRIANLEARI
jgi:hypothetical protein